MKFLKISFFFLIAFISNSYSTRASHFMGAQITYKSVGKYKYEVYFDFFRDCRGIPFSTPSCSVIDTKGGTIYSSVTLTLVSITDITPTCITAAKQCYPANKTSGNGVEKHSYKATIDLTTAAKNGTCQVQIGAGQCCRNGAITTGASGQDFWVWSMVDLCKWYKNSSPLFYSDPILQLYCNQPQYFNMAARDFIDNDSLVYEFVDPMQSWSSKTSWSGGKSSSSPISDYWPSGYNKSKGPNPLNNPPIGTYLNRSTGQLIFTTTDCSESTIAAMRISEYHKDSATGKYVLVGYVTKDMQYNSISGVSNKTPYITGPDNIYFVDSIESKYHYNSSDNVIIPKTGFPVLNDTIQLSMLAFVPLQSTNASFKIVDASIKNPSGIFK